MRFILIGLIFLLLLSINPLIAGGPDSLGLGGVYVRINSPKSKLLDRLGEKYTVNQLGGPDQWGIISKDSIPRSLGLVVFDSEKVAYVARDWGSYGDVSVNVFDSLYNGLRGLGKSGKATAKVSVSESREGDETLRVISLRFGKREMKINIHQSPGGPSSVGLEETLTK